MGGSAHFTTSHAADVESFLALLTLALLSAAGIIVLIAVVLALATPPRRTTATLLALAGAGFTAVWVVLSYRGGVRADETGTGGNILDDVAWLVAALTLSVTSLSLGARHRRHHSSLSSPAGRSSPLPPTPIGR